MSQAPSTPTLSDILNGILSAIQSILYNVANAIAENAGVIATVVVIGGITYFVLRYGSRMFRGLTSMLRGFF